MVVWARDFDRWSKRVIRWTLGMLFLCAWWMGCDGQDVETPCKPMGECERYLLLQCDCCDGAEIETCKTDRLTACATGRLQLMLDGNECQEEINQIEMFRASGGDYCEGFSPEQRRKTCTETILASMPTGGGGAAPPPPMGGAEPPSPPMGGSEPPSPPMGGGGAEPPAGPMGGGGMTP